MLCLLFQNNLQSSGPTPTALAPPVIAILQLANAIAGQVIPSVFVGNSLAIELTLFDASLHIGVTATVAMTAFAPDGTSQTLTVSSPTTGVFQAYVQLNQTGQWDIQASGTVGSGPPRIFAEGQVNAIGALVPVGAAVQSWFFVNASQSPYQAVPNIPDIAVDLRQGVVEVDFWTSPTDADEITINDWFGLAAQGSSGSGQPGGPIILKAAGSLIEDPSAPGTYASTVHVISPAKFVGTWRYSLLQNAWGFASYSPP